MEVCLERIHDDVHVMVVGSTLLQWTYTAQVLDLYACHIFYQ